MKKLPFLFLCFLPFLMACQTQSEPTKTDADQLTGIAYTDLSVADFKTKMTSEEVVLLDVRTPGEIAKGKIEGAKLIDFRRDNFIDELDRLDKTATYLVYCQVGGRSSGACKMMSEKGFKKLYNLQGGYTAWLKEKK